MNHRKLPLAARAALNAAPRHGLVVGGSAVVLNRHAQNPPTDSFRVRVPHWSIVQKYRRSRDCVVAKRGPHGTTNQPVQCSSRRTRGGFLVAAKLSQLLRRWRQVVVIIEQRRCRSRRHRRVPRYCCYCTNAREAGGGTERRGLLCWKGAPSCEPSHAAVAAVAVNAVLPPPPRIYQGATWPFVSLRD